MVATSAARAGVLNLVRSLATELAPRGIRVNGILHRPGRSRASGAAATRRRLRPARRWEEWTAALAERKAHPARPPRASRGSGARDRLPRLAARLVHHRHLHRRFRGTFPPCLSNQRMTVGELVAAFLERAACAAAFGVISIHNMPILDAFGRRAAAPRRRPPGADPVRARAERGRRGQHGRRVRARVRRPRRRGHQHRHRGRQRLRRDGRGADRRHAGPAPHRPDRSALSRSRPRLHPRGARPARHAARGVEGRVPRA